MTVTAEAILCGDCSRPLTDALPSDSLEQRKPCPHCGSTKRNFHVFIAEHLTLRDGFGMKVKHGESRPHYESKSVPDHSRSRGKLVHREMIVDRENDRYFERVTDYESGEIVHECDEPLSKHLGHGADKKNRKSDG